MNAGSSASLTASAPSVGWMSGTRRATDRGRRGGWCCHRPDTIQRSNGRSACEKISGRMVGAILYRAGSSWSHAVTSKHSRTTEYDVVPHGQYDVIQRDYYSPVPGLARLRDEILDRRSDLGGVELDLERSIELIERDLAPFIAELDVPTGNQGVRGRSAHLTQGVRPVPRTQIFGIGCARADPLCPNLGH